MQPLGVTALGGGAGALVVQVDVLHVEGEDFLRAGGGLIQQPPQALLPDGDVLAAEQPLQRGVGDGLGAVGLLRAPIQAGPTQPILLPGLYPPSTGSRRTPDHRSLGLVTAFLPAPLYEENR